MSIHTNNPDIKSNNWARKITAYTTSNHRKAVWQIINTLLPYFLLWSAMVYMVHNQYPYWSVLLLSLVAALFLLRIFIFFHDCCHGSFFKSRRANTILGYITGILTFTPFDAWRRSHNLHHASSGNLDRRGAGDVWTMTVEEYRTSPFLRRAAYRLYRNPLITFGLGPAYLFLISMRFPEKNAGKKEKRSVLLTNISLLLIILILGFTIGFKTYLMIQVPVILIAGIAGVWLFYVQHQFEPAYWSRGKDWDLMKSALEGSSFYKLPKILQWFTGNIGFHHIHHLRPKVPNYYLEECQNNIEIFQQIKPVTFLKSLKYPFLDLWDEEQQKLVSFHSVRR